jgi:hypothetical protein
MSPEQIINELTKRFEDLNIKSTWGETSIFFNPGNRSKNGAYFLTLKESDGENDKSSQLHRNGIFRVSFGISSTSYENLFGDKPPRAEKGGIVKTGHDFARVNTLMPHPIYAWMYWVQILSPKLDIWNTLQDLLTESYQLAKTRFEKIKS